MENSVQRLITGIVRDTQRVPIATRSRTGTQPAKHSRLTDTYILTSTSENKQPTIKLSVPSSDKIDKIPGKSTTEKKCARNSSESSATSQPSIIDEGVQIAGNVETMRKKNDSGAGSALDETKELYVTIEIPDKQRQQRIEIMNDESQISQLPIFRRHESVMKNVDQLEISRCQTVECNCQKLHCPLCSEDIFKPVGFVCNLKKHFLVHTKHSVKFNDVTCCMCRQRCKPESHYHCPLCETICVKKKKLVEHLNIQHCGEKWFLEPSRVHRSPPRNNKQVLSSVNAILTPELLKDLTIDNRPTLNLLHKILGHLNIKVKQMGEQFIIQGLMKDIQKANIVLKEVKAKQEKQRSEKPNAMKELVKSQCENLGKLTEELSELEPYDESATLGVVREEEDVDIAEEIREEGKYSAEIMEERMNKEKTSEEDVELAEGDGEVDKSSVEITDERMNKEKTSEEDVELAKENGEVDKSSVEITDERMNKEKTSEEDVELAEGNREVDKSSVEITDERMNKEKTSEEDVELAEENGEMDKSSVEIMEEGMIKEEPNDENLNDKELALDESDDVADEAITEDENVKLNEAAMNKELALMTAQIRVPVKRRSRAEIKALGFVFQCPVCKIEKYSRDSYYRHIQRHHKEKTFNCEKCSKSYSQKSDYQRHAAICKGPKESRKYEPNKERLGPIQCSICHMYFSSKDSLKSHIKYIHTDIGVCSCKICGKTFKAPRYLKTHMIRHNNARPFICLTCGRAFKERGALKEHTDTHRDKSERVKKYRCDLCPKAYFRLAALKDHKNVHSGLKPFACDICGKLYSARCSMNKHRLSHSVDRPYSCDKCNKAFKFRHKLRAHSITHTGQSPHFCSSCGKAFTTSTTLRKHICKGGIPGGIVPPTDIKPDPSLQLYMCSLCNLTFTDWSTVTQHMLLHAESDTVNTISLDNALVTMENSVVAMDNSVISMDNSVVTMDNSVVTMDNSVITMDNSGVAMDHAVVAMEHTAIAMQNRGIIVKGPVLSGKLLKDEAAQIDLQSHDLIELADVASATKKFLRTTTNCDTDNSFEKNDDTNTTAAPAAGVYSNQYEQLPQQQKSGIISDQQRIMIVEESFGKGDQSSHHSLDTSNFNNSDSLIQSDRGISDGQSFIIMDGDNEISGFEIGDNRLTEEIAHVIQTALQQSHVTSVTTN